MGTLHKHFIIPLESWDILPYKSLWSFETFSLILSFRNFDLLPVLTKLACFKEPVFLKACPLGLVAAYTLGNTLACSDLAPPQQLNGWLGYSFVSPWIFQMTVWSRKS